MQGEYNMAGLTKKGNTYYAIFSVNGKSKWKRIGRVEKGFDFLGYHISPDGLSLANKKFIIQ